MRMSMCDWECVWLIYGILLEFQPFKQPIYNSSNTISEVQSSSPSIRRIWITQLCGIFFCWMNRQSRQWTHSTSYSECNITLICINTPKSVNIINWCGLFQSKRTPEWTVQKLEHMFWAIFTPVPFKTYTVIDSTCCLCLTITKHIREKISKSIWKFVLENRTRLERNHTCRYLNNYS